MLHEMEFEEHYTHLLHLLMDMKQQLERYRQREGYSEFYVQKREEELVTIGRFVEVAVGFIADLKDENTRSYQAGFEKGKTYSPYTHHGYRRKDFNAFDALLLVQINEAVLRSIVKRMQGKGLRRRLVEERARMLWPELF